MILSHEHKFVFIKGEKVGGTSAEIALSQICGPDDVITPVSPRDEQYRRGTPGEPRNYTSHLYPAPLRRMLERRFVNSIENPPRRKFRLAARLKPRFINHMDLQSVLRAAPEARSYEVVCVERSPYAKVMSLANWLRNFQIYDQGGELPKEPTDLRSAVDQLISDGSIRRVLNIDRYRDLDRRITATAWRTESLALHFAEFCRSRGVEPVQLVSAKRGARSDSIEPTDALRGDQIAAINDIFAEEFEHFGWRMIR